MAGPQGLSPETTAQAMATATAEANTILEDPLTDHIHNWPLANRGPLQYKFVNGAYHVIVNDKEVWAGDGDSTLKVIDIKSQKITDSISTKGKMRVDEMAWDSRDKIIAAV